MKDQEKVEDIDLSEEDDKALDRAWKRIEEEGLLDDDDETEEGETEEEPEEDESEKENLMADILGGVFDEDVLSGEGEEPEEETKGMGMPTMPTVPPSPFRKKGMLIKGAMITGLAMTGRDQGKKIGYGEKIEFVGGEYKGATATVLTSIPFLRPGSDKGDIVYRMDVVYPNGRQFNNTTQSARQLEGNVRYID